MKIVCILLNATIVQRYTITTFNKLLFHWWYQNKTWRSLVYKCAYICCNDLFYWIL